MKLFFSCCLGALVLSQSAFAYDEALLRQQREWRATEKHYENLKPSVPYVSPYHFGTPYTPPAKRERRTWKPAPAAPRPTYVPPLITAEQRELERRVRQAAIEQERVEEAARVKRAAWQKKSLQDPYLTWNEPPVFSGDREKYQWFLSQADSDRAAALVAAQMAFDGQGTQNGERDLKGFFAAMSNTFFCPMQKALLGEMAIVSSQDDAVWRQGWLDLYSATYIPDRGGGQARAFAALRRLYNQGEVNGRRVTAHPKMAAAVALYFGARGDEKAAQEFMTLYAENPLIIEDNPAMMRDDVPVLMSKFQAPLGASYARGLTLLEKRDPRCFDEFAKALDGAPDDPAVGAMCGQLLAMTLQNDDLKVQLSTEEQDFVQAQALRWFEEQTRQRAAGKAWNAYQKAERALLFQFYLGACGVVPNAAAAQKLAISIFHLDQNREAVLQVGRAFRLGGAGWKQDDAEAERFFAMSLEGASEDNEAARWLKGLKHYRIAQMWDESAQTSELPLEPALAQKHYLEAARLYPELAILPCLRFLISQKTNDANQKAAQISEAAIKQFQKSKDESPGDTSYTKAISEINALRRQIVALP